MKPAPVIDCRACRIPWRLHTPTMRERCRHAFPLQEAVANLERLRRGRENR